MPTNNVELYGQENGVIAKVDNFHKRIGHMNPQRLKSMQSKSIVTGLPNFKVADMQKSYEM